MGILRAREVLVVGLCVAAAGLGGADVAVAGSRFVSVWSLRASTAEPTSGTAADPVVLGHGTPSLGLGGLASPVRGARGLGFGSALVGSAPAGDGPSLMAIDPATHTVYVVNGDNADGPNQGGNTVSVIDTRGCNAHDVWACRGPWPTVTVGNLPTSIAVDPATDTVYVTNGGDFVDPSTVSVFNGATCNAEDSGGCGHTPAEVPVGALPFGVYADTANRTVYVDNVADGTVSMIDSATCNGERLSECPASESPTVSVGADPGAVDVDQATHTVFVAQQGGVAVFDADTCNATTQSGCGDVATLTLSNGDDPFETAVDQANQTLYTANGDNTISAFDLGHCSAGDLGGCATDQPGTLTIPSPGGLDASIAVTVDPATHTVYVPFYHDDVVMAFDADACNGAEPAGCAAVVPREIHTGTEPESVVLDPTTQTLYTANEVDDDVSVIDASHCDASTTTGCRPLPPEVAFPQAGQPLYDEAASTVYIPSETGQVGVLDSTTCNAGTPETCPSAPVTFTAGDTPSDAALDPLSETVYIANAGDGSDGSVSVIDTRTCNAHTQTGCATSSTLELPGGADPVGVDVDQATNTVYVAADSSGGIGTPTYLYVFAGASCDARVQSGCSQTPVRVPLGLAAPASVAVDQATNTAYVALIPSFGTDTPGQVAVIDGATCNGAARAGCAAPIATLRVGVDPQEVEIDQDTDTIYTANQQDGDYQGTVSIVNGATCNAENASGCDDTPTSTTVGFAAIGLAVDQARNGIWVENNQDASISVIDGAVCDGQHQSGCRTPWPKLSVTDYPIAAAFADGTSTAYVAGWSGVAIVSMMRGPV